MQQTHHLAVVECKLAGVGRNRIIRISRTTLDTINIIEIISIPNQEATKTNEMIIIIPLPETRIHMTVGNRIPHQEIPILTIIGRAEVDMILTSHVVEGTKIMVIEENIKIIATETMVHEITNTDKI